MSRLKVWPALKSVTKYHIAKERDGNKCHILLELVLNTEMIYDDHSQSSRISIETIIYGSGSEPEVSTPQGYAS